MVNPFLISDVSMATCSAVVVIDLGVTAIGANANVVMQERLQTSAANKKSLVVVVFAMVIIVFIECLLMMGDDDNDVILQWSPFHIPRTENDCPSSQFVFW
jgi:hypothetical protein